MVVLVVSLLLGAASPPDADAAARGPAHITIAVVPERTTVRELARVPGMGVGILSAGVGNVSADQTYLDIGQGARVQESLYDSPLPRLTISGAEGSGLRVPASRWRDVRSRADSLPADILPGLLGSTLMRADVTRIHAVRSAPSIALPIVDEHGRVPAPRCHHHGCASVAVASADLAGVRKLAKDVRGDDLLIALGRPPPPANHGLPLGIAGRGFDGTLTSDSTRMRGYVLSTDLAPTILDRLGIAVPGELSGEPIQTEGTVDAAFLQDLQDRLAAIGPRRAPVVGLSVLGWVVLTALAWIARRRAGLQVALTILATSLGLLPGRSSPASSQRD
jgi:hypothetical protein